MKKRFAHIITAIILSLSFVSTILVTPHTYAAGACGENQVETSIIGGGGCQDVGDNGDGIFTVLNIVLQILTYGVGIAGTLGIVISGIQYLTARDNEQQMAKAKSRLVNIIIGLAAYAVMWGFLQWLLPGGILNGS